MKVGAWAGVFLAATFLGACGDSSSFDGGAEEAVGALDDALTKGTVGSKIGDADYCDSATNKCALGEGDCDSSSQCQTGLVCVPGNLAKRGASTGDACAPAHCGNGLKDSDETSIDCGGTCGWDCAISCDEPNGHTNHCSSDCPCSAGEGDCDGASECQAGLVCGTSNGPAFGLATGVDVCWASTCQNGVKDGNETAIDCGGDCAPCTPPPAGPVAVASLGAPLLPIVIAPHTDTTLHNQVLEIATDLKDKLNEIVGTTAFTIAVPSNTPTGISLGVHGDFPNSGWPYQGYFRPTDLYRGGAIDPERLALREAYVLRTPAGSSRVIVAGATVDGLRHAVWDMLSQVGYRHYFQTKTWEVTPSVPSLSLNLAISEGPAFAARHLGFDLTYWSNYVNESGYQAKDAAEVNAWLKHNRTNDGNTLTPTGTFVNVMTFWEQAHGQTFPVSLVTAPGAKSTQQFCLTGVATLNNGQTTTAIDVVKEWALAQTAPTSLSLSPNVNANWESSTNSNGSLNCNDASHAVFGNVANRIVALANAAAEAQPNKVISVRTALTSGESPSLALRQNAFILSNPGWANRPTPRPADWFALDAAESIWRQSSARGGVIDFFPTPATDLPGKVTFSTEDMVARVHHFYSGGARYYAPTAFVSGWGLAGPSLWALSRALWDADSNPSSQEYRNDFLSKAFGPAEPAARAYFDALENKPLWSEDLVGRMYRALQQGFLAGATPAQEARLADLAIYTRYLELYRKAFNRCSAVAPETEQTELKDLLKFVYATRGSKMLDSREAFLQVAANIPACPTGQTCTADGCKNASNQLTGIACVLPEWGVTCPSATPTAACGTCSGNVACNEMKNGTVPDLKATVTAGVLNTRVLTAGLTKTFSNDLVPYTPQNPSLPARHPTLYTVGPHTIFLQRPSGGATLQAHVTKYASNLLLLGQLSNPLTGTVVERKLLDRGPLEADWSFDLAGTGVYRLDLDDQSQRMWTGIATGTRLAIPTNINRPPTAFNNRWALYFMVPAGTQNVVGWSQTDGAFYRYRKTANGSFETIQGYLSDYAVGHACTTPRVVIDSSPSGALDDHFVIPIPADKPVSIDEIWLFNDGNGGTTGDRALLSVPPFLYRDPAEMLVPREVSPEGLNPQACSGNACPTGQYCSQQGVCRTDNGGGCTANNQCPSNQSCQSGQCACASNTSCGPTCRCGTGGGCTSSADCLTGYSCQAGTCQGCANASCTGEPCSSGSDCAIGLVCEGGQCRESCATHPTAPDCVESTCGNGILDGAETDIDCGAGCEPCTKGEVCTTSSDCSSGLECGTNNGGYFGKARATRVCWPTACEDGVSSSECGSATSLCGPNCGGVKPCTPNDPNASCPNGEACQPNMGRMFGSPVEDVCVDSDCPSNDPALCGTPSSLCGEQCVCLPNCSGATAANPNDGCGGVCPHLCQDGQACCTTDLNCAIGSSCQLQADGSGLCRKSLCTFARLVPPLCGHAGAICGDQCPACTPECDGKQCGLDPKCGVSCGTCGGDDYCSSDGQCRPTASTDPPLQVKDGHGNPVDVTPLPLAPGVPVGALPGAFSVSELGSAQYNIPITVPPGRAGMEPGLSLRYSGTKADGQAGVGWQLEGLSKITRCPKIFALDRHSAPIKNDETDLFCIDGKRIETVAGSQPYGTNGAEYRTLVDTFAKVVSYQEGDGFQLDAPVSRVARPQQGPDYFKVWMKDGRILTYGRTRDALVMLPNGVRSTWLLNRVEDRAHNTMQVEYTNLQAISARALALNFPNIVRPYSISYTGHYDVAGDREVRFGYEGRDDSRLSFLQGGTPSLLAERLSQVTTYVKKTPVRNYRLKYRGTSVSQVESVKECVGDQETVCKPGTTFEYEEQTGFIQGRQGNDIAGSSQLDVNGDGIPDFMVTTVSSNGIPEDKTLRAVYIGGDIAAAAGGVAASIYLTPAAGIAVDVTWTLTKELIHGLFGKSPTYSYSRELYVGSGSRTTLPTYISSVTGIPCNRGPSFFADYDQDGKDDVVDVCLLHDMRVARSLGNGQFSTSTVFSTFEPNVDVLYNLPPPLFYDVDGDSLQDLVRCRTASALEVHRRLAPDRNFDENPVTLLGIPGDSGAPLPFCGNKAPTYQVIDLDGDGTPELLTRLQHDGRPASLAKFGRAPGWYALRFTMDGTAPKVDFEPVTFPDVGTSALGEGMLMTDVNGDGLNDIWRTRTNDEEVTAWLNTGQGFMPQTFARPRVVLPLEPRAKLRFPLALDFNSDGRQDILEQWVLFSGGAFSNGQIGDTYNVLVTPNGFVNAADTSLLEFPKLVLPDNQGIMPAPFTNFGDIDGDGNDDLFGVGGWTFYGSGSRNLLLKTVKDGMGKIVHVQYDQTGTYKHDCEQGTQWPERCLPIVRGLVSQYTEGFVAGSGSEKTDRIYSYRYQNARVNLTGHGWLGFDKRTVSESTDAQVRTVTTQFEPLARYQLNGSQASDLAQPYFYPLAGLARTVTVDEGRMSATSAIPAGLEDVATMRRTVVTNTWDVAESGSDRPYPRLEYKSTESYSRPNGSIAEPTPWAENGHLRFGCNERFSEFNDYGDPREYSQKCHNGESESFENSSITLFTSNAATWFVSQPKSISESSERDGVTHTRTTSFDYQDELLQKVTRDPGVENQSTTYFRDSYGNIRIVVESVAPSLVNGVSTPETPRTTTIGYDDDGVFPRRIVQSVSGSVALVTQVEIDPRFGEVSSTVDPNDIPSQRRYDEFGTLVEQHGPDGVTTYSYSALPGDRVMTEVGPLYPRVQVAVTPPWKQIPNGTASPAVVYELDSYGRLTRSMSEGFGGANVITERTYDTRGRLTDATRPHLANSPSIPTVHYAYDHLDRVTRIENSDGSFSTHEYASRVNLTSDHEQWVNGIRCPSIPGNMCAVDVELITSTRFEDEEPKKNVIVRDAAGNVLRTIDGENVDDVGASSNFDYGPFDELIQLRDNEDNVTAFERDHYGRVRSHVDPDSGITTFTYNGFGEVKTRKDPNQKLSVYTYDAIGRVRKLEVGPDITTWAYDVGPGALGQLSSSKSPATTENPTGQEVAYGYEASNGLPSSTTFTIDGQSYTLGVHYDDWLRPERIDYPTIGGGTPIQARLDYDTSSGALRNVAEVGSGTQRPIWHLDTAFEGQLAQQITFGNGAVSTFGYDADRRWLKTVQTTLAGDTIQDLEYSRYGNGQVHERITPTRTREYTYDAVGRLASMLTSGIGTARQYRYDTAGNITQRGSTINNYHPSHRHELESVGSITYGYEHGNVTSRTGVEVPGGSQTFEYTPFNLPSVIRTGTGTAERVTTFDYSADAQRVVRRDPEGARHFASNLYQRLLSPGGATVEERFRIPAGGSIVAEIIRRPGTSDRTLYFHDDHLGTPDTISDSDHEFTRQDYGPFGEPVGDPPDINQDLTRLGFTGHQQENDLGLIDMGGRIYDPLAARFMTPDPIMQAPFSSQGQNRYSYVFNDPINRTDPSGFSATGDAVGYGAIGTGYGIVGYGIVTEMVAAFGAQATLGAAGSVGGAGANILRSLALAGGSPGGGGKTTVASPTGAPNSLTVRSGTQATATNRPLQVLQEQGRPPGLSLFDPEAGALACGGSGDVCMEIQRQRLAALQAEMNKKIEMIEAAEWELFWAYTGGKAIQFGVKAVRAFRAWRLARAAAAAANTGPIIGHLADVSAHVARAGGRTFTSNLTGEALLKANQAWLDKIVANREVVQLATNFGKAREGSVFWSEVRYLMSRGYAPNASGTALLPP